MNPSSLSPTFGTFTSRNGIGGSTFNQSLVFWSSSPKVAGEGGAVKYIAILTADAPDVWDGLVYVLEPGGVKTQLREFILEDWEAVSTYFSELNAWGVWCECTDAEYLSMFDALIA